MVGENGSKSAQAMALEYLDMIERLRALERDNAELKKAVIELSAEKEKGGKRRRTRWATDYFYLSDVAPGKNQNGRLMLFVKLPEAAGGGNRSLISMAWSKIGIPDGPEGQPQRDYLMIGLMKALSRLFLLMGKDKGTWALWLAEQNMTDLLDLASGSGWDLPEGRQNGQARLPIVEDME